MASELVKLHDLGHAGLVANQVAQSSLFARELAGLSENTRSAYQTDLQTWHQYLESCHIDVRDRDWFGNAAAWRGVTAGLVAGFNEWLKAQGFAVGTINRKLACVRKFCSLAAQSGVINATEIMAIQNVKLITRNAGIEIDKQRDVVRIERVNAKKAAATKLGRDQAKRLKQQPDTPQGRRDSLLMCLALDHGLRAGEIAGLSADCFDIDDETFTFYREKVKKTQVHRMTPDTLAAYRRYVESGDCPATGPVLRSSLKSGGLAHNGMARESVSRRIKQLGREIGLSTLSAHDCRHYWTTLAVRSGSDPFAVQQAGGWNSMTTVSRYVAESEIANDGIVLSK